MLLNFSCILSNLSIRLSKLSSMLSKISCMPFNLSCMLSNFPCMTSINLSMFRVCKVRFKTLILSNNLISHFYTLAQHTLKCNTLSNHHNTLSNHHSTLSNHHSTLSNLYRILSNYRCILTIQILLHVLHYRRMFFNKSSNFQDNYI